MRPLLQSSLVALLLFSSTFALAQSRELHQTKRESKDDARDRAGAASLLRRYDEALSRKRGAVSSLDSEVLRLMDAELAEGRRELRRDKHEVVRSSHELKDSRHDRVHAGGPPARAEVRDDRRDLRDDQRDLRVEYADLKHVRAIRADFASLRGRTYRAALLKKRALLADFLDRSHRELRQDVAERREDVRERREDRR